MGVFVVFFIYPLFYALYISRYDWGVFGKIETLGLENYRTLLHDDLFWKGLKNTVMYTAVVVPLQMALGLSVAVIVNVGIRGRTFFRSAFYFPGARLLGRDHRDRALHPLRRRPPERRSSAASGRGSATPTRRSGRSPA